MKYSLLLTLIISILLFGCSKEDDKPECEQQSFGWIQFQSTSDNPYSIYLDGVFKRSLNGGGIIKYEAGIGTHQVRALQESGYLIYPTDVEQNIVVNECEITGFTFP